MISISAKNKNIAIRDKMSDLVPPYINADYNRLQQILINLMNNALKFTRNGYIEVRVSRNHQHTQDNQNQLVFEVEDTGIGIQDCDKGTLFQMF